MSISCAWMERASMHGPVQAHVGPNSTWICKLIINSCKLDVQMVCNQIMQCIFKWFPKLYQLVHTFENDISQTKIYPYG